LQQKATVAVATTLSRL